MNATTLRDRQGETDDARDPSSGIISSQQERHVPGSETRNARTFNGWLFVVPNTPDMVTQLFSPIHAKNTGDLTIVSIIALHLVLYFFLSPAMRAPTFGALFFFWRASYNGGIGNLLRLQSKDQRLVGWANKSKIFLDAATVKGGPQYQLHHFLKTEMETSVKDGYVFEKAPIEFNTWLLFRRLADLVLMCDFTSYCLFAAACGRTPFEQWSILTWLRWIVGVSLIAANLWIKVDAHRVVKENWYWADFFFVIEQKLEFKGIFKWFKDPMYTVGYIGYYGISLMTGSFRVLAASIAAHAAQLAFLRWVEEPHFTRIYEASVKDS